MKNYCEISINAPLKGPFTYAFDPDAIDLKVGNFVWAPWGKRKERGVVLRVFKDLSEAKQEVAVEKIKEVDALSSKEVILTTKDLQLYDWISRYYHYALGKIIGESFPESPKRAIKKSLAVTATGERRVDLTPEQQRVFKSIHEHGTGHFSALIHGVTGSGKTFIYLELIRDTLKRGKSVLFLVPEINLTPQLVDRFKEYLTCEIFTYHSAVTVSQKYHVWAQVQNSAVPKLILGTRSSVFLSFEDLGLIVIDEEHDSSFKQEDRCPYHARDVALQKAKIHGIPLLMGSATPSLETYYHYSKKRSEFYYHLKERALQGLSPKIRIVDIRRAEKDADDRPIPFSAESNPHWPLEEAPLKEIRRAFDHNEQAIVFINRLGFSNYLQCPGCGYQFQCKNCSTVLRYFKGKNLLSCSFCDYKQHVPNHCPECSCMNLSQRGFGTEKVEEVLQQFFPDKTISRFDRDEVRSVKLLVEKLNAFHSGAVDLFVATQMLSKGHNFERVNLVVVLGLDAQLNFPDFRAQERAFQQLVQISGRSGRFGPHGQVMIQTLNPDGPIYRYLPNEDYSGWCETELEIREQLALPPYSKMIALTLSSKDGEELKDVTMKISAFCRQMQAQHFKNVGLVGPYPCFIERRANYFSWIYLFKSNDLNSLHNLISTLEKNPLLLKGIKFKIDVDPLSVS